MKLDLDTVITAFWIGCFLFTLCLTRRIADIFAVFILWFACFPSLEGIFRSVLHTVMRKHPIDFWELALTAAVPYVLAVLLLWLRVHQHRKLLRPKIA